MKKCAPPLPPPPLPPTPKSLNASLHTTTTVHHLQQAPEVSALQDERHARLVLRQPRQHAKCGGNFLAPTGRRPHRPSRRRHCWRCWRPRRRYARPRSSSRGTRRWRRGKKGNKEIRNGKNDVTIEKRPQSRELVNQPVQRIRPQTNEGKQKWN